MGMESCPWIPSYTEAEIFARQVVKGNLCRGACSLDGKQIFDWNVAISRTVSQAFHWFAFFTSVSCKEILWSGPWNKPVFILLLK